MSFSKATLSEQVAMSLRQSIQYGELSRRTKLPPSQQLAKQYGISTKTMQKALHQLRKDRLIKLHSRRKGFVISNPANLAGQDASAAEVANGYLQVAVLLPCSPERLSGNINGKRLLTTGPWSGKITDAFIATLSAKNYIVSILHYDHTKKGKDIVNSLSSQIKGVDNKTLGFVCFSYPSPNLPEILKEFDSHSVPWITINRPDEMSAENFVAADNVGGSQLVGYYFGRMKFKKVLYVGDKIAVPSSTTLSKIGGFVEGYLMAGMSLEGFKTIEDKGNLEQDGYDITYNYIKNQGPPNAIFTSGDNLAIGAMHACQDSGLEVPEQVSIVGSTGLATSAQTRPGLSVLKQPMAEMGIEAAEMLDEMIHDGICRIQSNYLPCEFIFRQSLKIDDEVIEDLKKRFPKGKISIEPGMKEQNNKNIEVA